MRPLTEYQFRAHDRPTSRSKRTPRKRAPSKRVKPELQWIGIDGEGLGRDPHLYTLLAWCDETGQRSGYVEDHRGLTTMQCLELLLSTPGNARLFAYSFQYDLTMMLRDLPNHKLYALFHPERRADARGVTKPVKWKGYKLNLVATRFSVSKGKTRRVVWDVWKFFQGKFVSALRDWKVGTPELWERMSRMKDKRSELDKEKPEAVRAYCLEECQCMGQLARKLTEAHETAGYTLTSYYGAGSTASAVLKSLGVAKLRDPGPVRMRNAVASAFFGGRFENSILGACAGPVYSFDISSAYPYQLTRLPCLVHAQWELTSDERRLERARHALISYRLHDIGDAPWAPFPFRDKTGSITFPRQSGGGWVWRDEYLAGRQLFPGQTRFIEAWVLESDCDCGSPFRSIASLYRERVRIGKEGPGIVLKLGCNSVYGKLAQSVGKNPPYQSWIWAGMITSGTRAQILDMLALHSDPSDLLMVATDGIYTRQDIKPPTPEETGTSDLQKPLGGWERKVVDKGVFAARPGVYFPQNPTAEELSDVRARGLGKAIMYKHWKLPVEALQRGETEVRFPNVNRFCGALSSIHVSRGKHNRAPTYGQWVEREIVLSLDPLPKRELGEDGLLKTRTYPLALRSEPYDSAVMSQEALELQLATLEANEQPDGGDYTENE